MPQEATTTLSSSSRYIVSSYYTNMAVGAGRQKNLMVKCIDGLVKFRGLNNVIIMRKKTKSSYVPQKQNVPATKQRTRPTDLYNKTTKRIKPTSVAQQAKSRSEKTSISVRSSLSIRLNRYVANAGVCSRREADTLILKGDIAVNGKIIKDLGVKINRNDQVKHKGKTLQKEKKVYVLLNKPKDYITTKHDPQGRKTVMQLVNTACQERIYPVGRLDRQTSGLLLLTNDGELTDRLIHPSHKVKKIYHLQVNRPVSENDYKRLINNEIVLEDGTVMLDGFNFLDAKRTDMGIALHSGRNRVVRRMFEHMGYEVTKLDRTVFAGLTKINLPRGKWRFLSEKEIIRLKFFKS